MANTREKAREATDHAEEQAQEAAARLSDRAREQLDLRTTDAGERIDAAAQDARGVADHLREQGNESGARLADQAADRAEQLADYLVDATPDHMLRDVEDFGRRQPWAIAVGGLALGFAGARFLGASSGRRYRGGSGGDRQREPDVARPEPAQGERRAVEPPGSRPPRTGRAAADG